jgi:hypothetical protein
VAVVAVSKTEALLLAAEVLVAVAMEELVLVPLAHQEAQTLVVGAVVAAIPTSMVVLAEAELSSLVILKAKGRRRLLTLA